MTTELTIFNKQYKDVPVRIINQDGVPYIVLNDIADAIGHDRSALRKLLKRNSTHLGVHTCKVKFAVQVGHQVREVVGLTSEGVVGLLVKLDYVRIKDKNKKERVVAFQTWATDTLNKLIKGEAIQVPPKQLGDLVSQHLQIADAICVYAHVDRGIATSIALSRVEYETGVDLSAYKNLLPKARQQPVANLTPTQIGKELGLTPITVNKILEKLGYQYYMGNDWHPTHVGDAYSEAFPVTGIAESGKSYSRYQLKWAPRIVELLREHLFGIDEMKKKGEITGYIG